MIILRPKNVIFERFWPFSKFHFPACSTLAISMLTYFIINSVKLNIWRLVVEHVCMESQICLSIVPHPNTITTHPQDNGPNGPNKPIVIRPTFTNKSFEPATRRRKRATLKRHFVLENGSQ